MTPRTRRLVLAAALLAFALGAAGVAALSRSVTTPRGRLTVVSLVERHYGRRAMLSLRYEVGLSPWAPTALSRVVEFGDPPERTVEPLASRGGRPARLAWGWLRGKGRVSGSRLITPPTTRGASSSASPRAGARPSHTARSSRWPDGPATAGPCGC